MAKTTLKAFLMSFLVYGVFGKNEQGYLVTDNSMSTPYCETLPKTNVCQFVNRTVEFADYRMKKIRESLYSSLNSTLNFFELQKMLLSQSCKKNVDEYYCSQVYICDNKNTSFSEDAERKKKACHQIKQSCPELVKSYLLLDNCEDITWSGALLPEKCIRLPDTKNDVCPKRNYKVHPTMNMTYSVVMASMQRVFSFMGSYLSPSCSKIFINIQCYINGGPICSEDNRMYIHVVSYEQCREALNKCRVSEGPKKAEATLWLSRACSGFPLNTTRKVQLPPGIDAKSILEPSMGTDDNGCIKNGLTIVYIVLIMILLLL